MNTEVSKMFAHA